MWSSWSGIDKLDNKYFYHIWVREIIYKAPYIKKKKVIDDAVTKSLIK